MTEPDATEPDGTEPAVSDPAGAASPGPPWSEGPGAAIVKADLAGTLALLLVTVFAALSDADAVTVANLVVAGALFVGGCATFAVGFVRAAGRSRLEVLDLAGLFYLTGSAPRSVRRVMLGSWFAQIAVAAASVVVARPPFGVMAPVFGIGLLTLWAARHGKFPVRPLPDRLARRSGPQ